jgi:hypothetical protein
VSALLPETLGNNPQSYCSVTEPWLTQVKGVAAYTLPRYAALPATLAMVLQNMQVAGTFQSIPGSAKSSTYSMSSQAVYSATGKPQDPRGNELANPALSTLPGGLVNGSSKNVALIAPSTVFDDRQNQLDVRIGKIVRFGRTRTSLNFDVFNVTNANTVLNRNNNITRNLGFASTANNAPIVQTTAVGAVNQAPQGAIVGGFNTSNTLWTPTSILQARFFKVSATFDF